MEFKKYKPKDQLDMREIYERTDDVPVYVPKMQARPSSLDTFLTCPLKSTLPTDIDEFTSYIGKILHYSHQHPDLAQSMIDLFMMDYRNIVGENDNNLKNMLYQYVERGREFIEENKENTIRYEAPISTDVFGIWISGHPDIIKLEKGNDDVVEVIDFKSAKSPGSYNGILDPKNGITKAQPYIYCYLACLLTARTKSIFTYYVYGKGKTPKLYKHSIEFEFEDLEKIIKDIIIRYNTSMKLDMREPNRCDSCFYCKLGYKMGNGSCPIWKRD